MALRVLFVKPWVDDLEPALEALRACDLEVTYERVDLAPALWAALERTRWDVVVTDWKATELTLAVVSKLVREHRPDLPVVVLDRLEILGRDVLRAVARQATG